jgi:hypothetical protein
LTAEAAYIKSDSRNLEEVGSMEQALLRALVVVGEAALAVVATELAKLLASIVSDD